MTEGPYHVYPTWESHDETWDCWCEPTLEEGMVIHHARVCRGGARHVWFGAECAECGQRRADCAQGARWEGSV